MTVHLQNALLSLTLPALEHYAARAERRAQLARRLTHTAYQMGLGPSLNYAADISRDRDRTASWLRGVIRERRRAAGLCDRCGAERASWASLCRDCADDYAN